MATASLAVGHGLNDGHRDIVPTAFAMSVCRRLNKNNINLSAGQVQQVLNEANITTSNSTTSPPTVSVAAPTNSVDVDHGILLSPVLSRRSNRAQPRDLKYMLGATGPNHFRVAFEADTGTSDQQAYTLHVEAGSRLERAVAAATLARIFGKHGFQAMRCVRFKEVLNINVCLAFAMLGFFLESIQAAPDARDGAPTVGSAVGSAVGSVGPERYDVKFASHFPRQARSQHTHPQTADGGGFPPWSPHDLQYQTVLTPDNRFFTSYLDLRTNVFQWREMNKKVHKTITCHMDKILGRLQKLNREYLAQLDGFFAKHAKSLRDFWAVGKYTVSGVECWFIGTMQDVFDKSELLRRQPGNPLELLGNLQVCFFSKSGKPMS